MIARARKRIAGSLWTMAFTLCAQKKSERTFVLSLLGLKHLILRLLRALQLFLLLREQRIYERV